jgi:hypothetical protein
MRAERHLPLALLVAWCFFRAPDLGSALGAGSPIPST